MDLGAELEQKLVDSPKLQALFWMGHEDNKGMNLGQSQLEGSQIRL